MNNAEKSIKEKRMDFELNQAAAQATRSNANDGGFDKALRDAQAMVDGPI